MLVYKPKQHLKQRADFNYLINFEKTHLKFSLTSQSGKTTILRIVFNCSRTKKATTGLVSSNNQSVQAYVNKAWKQQGLILKTTLKQLAWS